MLPIGYDDVRDRTLPNLLATASSVHGPRIFLRDGPAGATLSFSDAHDAARAVAAGLVRLGVRPGQLVPLLLPNCPEFVLSWFATSLCGAGYIAVNTSLVGPLLSAQLALGGARLWIVHARFLPALQEVPEQLRASVEVLVVVGLSAEQTAPGWAHVVRYEELLAEPGAPPDVAVRFTDVAAVTFTSGTTGPSKGVMTTQAQACSIALTFASVIGLQRDDVIYTPLPLFHGVASRMGMLPPLLTGCQVVLGERFSASAFWRQAAAADATVAHTIFSIPNILLAQPPGPQDRAHRVSRMFNAHHNAAFEARFGATLVEAFGISEVGLFIASPFEERRPGSSGRSHPDWEVAVMDEDGLVVPDGMPGELACRPRRPGIMMRGYLNQPDRTTEATRDLWYHTGDIARRDTEGYFWFLDRAKERIRRRGENISSWEIEQSVRAHPDIADVAAVAHPARAGEDDIRLLVVPRPGRALAEGELHAWIQARLPRFMVPRYIELTEALPYTATNKVEKGLLMATGLGPQAWDAEHG